MKTTKKSASKKPAACEQCKLKSGKLYASNMQISNLKERIVAQENRLQSEGRLRQQLTAASLEIDYLNRVIDWVCEKQGIVQVTPGARVRSRKTGLFGLVERAAVPEAYEFGGEWWVLWTTSGGRGGLRSLAKTSDLLVLIPPSALSSETARPAQVVAVPAVPSASSMPVYLL